MQGQHHVNTCSFQMPLYCFSVLGLAAGHINRTESRMPVVKQCNVKAGPFLEKKKKIDNKTEKKKRNLNILLICKKGITQTQNREEKM